MPYQKKASGYIWSNYIHKIGFRIFKEGHTFLHTLRYQKTKYKIFEIYKLYIRILVHFLYIIYLMVFINNRQIWYTDTVFRYVP